MSWCVVFRLPQGMLWCPRQMPSVWVIVSVDCLSSQVCQEGHYSRTASQPRSTVKGGSMKSSDDSACPNPEYSRASSTPWWTPHCQHIITTSQTRLAQCPAPDPTRRGGTNTRAVRWGPDSAERRGCGARGRFGYEAHQSDAVARTSISAGVGWGEIATIALS
ncbi:uncharacterized protein J3D65DRAFT_450344 [Phyllosticta citribraziliensis]|uniref:Uncharacterized protein n=1 Tax=Phyllosticta citribraziliensis TaxID=989973 RepID=A0ABR1LNM9_9PEZI